MAEHYTVLGYTQLFVESSVKGSNGRYPLIYAARQLLYELNWGPCTDFEARQLFSMNEMKKLASEAGMPPMAYIHKKAKMYLTTLAIDDLVALLKDQGVEAKLALESDLDLPGTIPSFLYDLQETTDVFIELTDEAPLFSVLSKDEKMDQEITYALALLKQQESTTRQLDEI